MALKRTQIDTQDSGLFRDLVTRIKLILRLIGDRRVSFFAKLLPIAAAIYVISPIDLIPGLALPVIGMLDDAAAIWLGTTLFMALCPDEVVKEHTDALNRVVAGSWRKADEAAGSGEVIHVEARDDSR